MSNALSMEQAGQLSDAIKILLQKNGQWVKITADYKTNGLDCLKIEASIKIKQ